MHYSRQLAILKNKILALDNTSTKEITSCKNLFFKIQRKVAIGTIRRILGATVFALLLQLISSEVKSQSRAVFNYGPDQLNPFGFQTIQNSAAYFPTVADLDGDGDIDMIITCADTSTYQAKFLYYKNIGDSFSPAFDSPSNAIFPDTIANSNSPLSFPVLVDLDGDGDLDLMVGNYDYSASNYEGKFAYYQNVGTASNPQFASGVDNPFGLSSPATTIFWSPSFADIDGDGDMDMIASCYSGVMYFKNSGTATAPQFDAPVELSTAFGITQQGVNFISLVDMDGDGDMDIFINDYNDNKLLFFENTGSSTNPSFALPVENPGTLVFSQNNYKYNFVKFDADADEDIFIGTDAGVIYKENLELGVGIRNSMAKEIEIAPTVSSEFIHILNLKDAIYTVTAYNPLGTPFQLNYTNQTINIKSLPDGFYYLYLIDQKGEFYIAPFIKQ